MAGLVLIVNFVLTIWTVAKFSVDGGLCEIFDGNCDEAKETSMWLHLGINVLSSVLLGASNYCMQVNSAPTRVEVDQAHAKSQWVDIGVPSVRNLWTIGKRRVILWWALGLSSVPLHLLYNSVVFEALAANNFDVVLAQENFLHGGWWNETISILASENSTLRAIQEHYVANPASYTNLSNIDCINAYNQPFMTNRRNLILISATASSNENYTKIGSVLDYYIPAVTEMSLPTEWLCLQHSEWYTGSGSCDTKVAVQHASSWSWEYVFTAYENGEYSASATIDYCMSEVVEGHCKLYFNVTVMAIVLCCNLAKTVCMFLTVYKQSNEILVTVGDAIVSFLDNPDLTTKGMCLLSKTDVDKGEWRKRQHAPDTTPKTWNPEKPFWYKAASLKRWLTCIILQVCTIVLSIAGFLLSLGLDNLSDTSTDTSFSTLWNNGFGAIRGNSLVDLGNQVASPSLVIGYILLANLPQGILSFLYLMYNALYTAMLLAHEWNGYAHSRKTLRVTSPTGKQRSTYNLQLPYLYALPLLACSSLLHWLVSQSIFLARISMYDDAGNVEDNYDIVTCGYSCIAIICTIFVGSILVIAVVLNGCRKYRPGLPLVSSCSAAISAACHNLDGDPDAAFLPVKWGVMKLDDDNHNKDRNITIGHCSFTSDEVTMPVPGEKYAGIRSRAFGFSGL
ncbi:MAG: hypothetical protein M1834_008243 [Cirrosporium novae-zelandiae]|nr:MAG: hypothetical protein M1834_008243 [Cirrosporium novae-zelandiae]